MIFKAELGRVAESENQREGGKGLISFNLVFRKTKKVEEGLDPLDLPCNMHCLLAHIQWLALAKKSTMEVPRKNIMHGIITTKHNNNYFAHS